MELSGRGEALTLYANDLHAITEGKGAGHEAAAQLSEVLHIRLHDKTQVVPRLPDQGDSKLVQLHTVTHTV